MKTLLMAYWKPILFILFFGFVFSLIGINQCKEDKQTLATENANISILRAFLIDSTRTSVLEADIAKLDSVKAEEADRTELATANAKYWESIANKRGKTAEKYKNKADSLSQYAGEDCKPFLDAYREANDSLKSENVALDSANTALHDEAEGYSRQLYLCEKQSTNKDSVVTEHKKYITTLETNIGVYKCYRDWGLKHRFWKWVFGWKCD